MIVRENVPFRELTTFKVGGPVRFLLECENEKDVREAVLFAHEKNLPWMMLGEGSNVLPSDEGYTGAVICLRTQELSFEERESDTLVHVSAGYSWDALVREAALRGLWGIENMAGIPGTVGAAPVQNIGAYGAELKNVLHEVEVFDANTNEIRTLTNEACEFSYRDSRFKREPNLIILRVVFSLTKNGASNTEYPDLVKAKAEGKDLSTPALIGEAVRAVRAYKFPDLSAFGTAGSFFKNPILSQEAYDALVAMHGPLPQFPNPAGIKIPLAFVLDKILGLKGFRLGNAFLFGNQPLVLVADLGATAKEVDALAKYIEAKVGNVTGIKIEREVRTLFT